METLGTSLIIANVHDDSDPYYFKNLEVLEDSIAITYSRREVKPTMETILLNGKPYRWEWSIAGEVVIHAYLLTSHKVYSKPEHL